MSKTIPEITDPRVLAVFEAYPTPARIALLRLRALILQTAAANPSVGVLEETLKWGGPAYLTAQTKSGSTVRLGWKPSQPMQQMIYFNGRTTLVDSFRARFPTGLRFEGNRAIALRPSETLPVDKLRFCIAAALTYHLARTPAPSKKH